MTDSWIELLAFPGNELCLRFALTLIHFLWQGTVIGVLVAAAVWTLRGSPPSSRYTLHSMALVCLPVCVAVTFATVKVPRHWVALNKVDGLASLPADNELALSTEFIAMDSPTDSEARTQLSGEEFLTAPLDQAVERANAKRPSGTLTNTHPQARPFFVRLAPTVAVIYFVGASLFLLRLMAATWGGHRLRIASIPIDDPSLLKLVVDQSRRVGLRLIPTVAYCERVAVPMAVGVLRPVVLLPASIMTGLDPEQFAAIISHELAHIRRYDLLMNLIQRLIESLLFFHPVVWYISRRMSAERESCCDDLVVSSGYAPMVYAGALLQMAELCSPGRQADAVAVAASGRNVSQFEVRIQRLMNGSRGAQLRLTRVGVLMIALLVCSIAATPALVRSQAHARSDATPSESNEQSRDESQPPKTEEAPEVAAPPSSLWPAQLSGVVKDMDGSGIDGAKVLLTVTEYFREGTDDGEQTLKTVQTTSDESGQYTVTTDDWPVPSAERPYSVRYSASAPGYAPWQTWFFNRAGYRKVRESLPELKLPPGKEITGRCVDTSGKPVVGATIHGLTTFNQPGIWQRPHDPTDKDGRFRVVVPEGHDAALSIVSGSEGHEQVDIPAAHDDPLHVVMRGGTSLVGQVESLSGEPVAGTLVVLEQPQGNRKYKYATVLRFAAETDEQGRFRIPLARGEFRCFLAQASRSDERAGEDYFVFAERAAPPLATVMVSLDGKSGHKEIALRESETVRLGGTIRLEDGRPVEGCPIKVYCKHAKIDQLVSDKDGQYSTNVPATQQEFIIASTNVTNHRSRAAPHSPGEHQGQLIILKGVTEDVTNVDYVFVSRHKNVQQPAKTTESVRFWEDLVNIPEQEPQPTDGASRASRSEEEEAPAKKSAENADEEVARLQKIWHGWSNTVKSMEVEGFEFLTEFGETGRSREAVRQLIFETILPNIEPGVTTLDELKSVTAPMYSDQPSSDDSRPFGAWRPFTLVEDADAVRVDEEIDGRQMVTVRKDGREQQYTEGSKQASLFTKHTGLRIPRIKTFLPNHTLSNAKNLEWKLESTASDETQRLELVNADGRGIIFEYDGPTGFVRDHAMLLSKDTYYSERIQSHPIATPSGVTVPQIVVDLHFSQTPDDGSVVRWIELYVINQLELNQPVAPERFQISVPAGTRIVRFEGGDNHVPPSQGGSRPQITTVDRPVPDVLAVPVTTRKADAGSKNR